MSILRQMLAMDIPQYPSTLPSSAWQPLDLSRKKVSFSSSLNLQVQPSKSDNSVKKKGIKRKDPPNGDNILDHKDVNGVDDDDVDQTTLCAQLLMNFRHSTFFYTDCKLGPSSTSSSVAISKPKLPNDFTKKIFDVADREDEGFISGSSQQNSQPKSQSNTSCQPFLVLVPSSPPPQLPSSIVSGPEGSYFVHSLSAAQNSMWNTLTTQWLKCTVTSECGQIFVNNEKLFEHYWTSHERPPFRCYVAHCQTKGFFDISQLEEHIKRCHPPSSTLFFTCPDCNKPFQSNPATSSHFWFNHVQGVYRCSASGCNYFGLLPITVYRHHVQTHTTRIFVCNLGLDSDGRRLTGGDQEKKNCGRQFNSRTSLKLHQRFHLKVKPYQCRWPHEPCQYASQIRSNVIRHVRTRHLGLPASTKEQQRLGIVDNRNPNDYISYDRSVLKTIPSINP